MRKTESSDLLGMDGNAVFCPTCGSNEVQKIPEEDEVVVCDVFALMDVPTLLN